MERLLTRYAKNNTRSAYLFQLDRYLTWLRETKGVLLTPDELMTDNLVCIFKSDPTDVATKRKHTDWLDEFVNRTLLEKGEPESGRTNAASIVKMFYRVNDSPLFGSFCLPCLVR